MALTLDRWIALAIAGCLVAMALIFSEGKTRPKTHSVREVLAARQSRLSFASAGAAYRLRLTELRDSIRGANGTPSSGARILVTGGFSPSDKQRLNAFFTRAALSRPTTSHGPVDYAVVTDAQGTTRGRTVGVSAFDYATFLPTAAYDRCLSMAKLGGAKVGGNVIRSDWFTSADNVAGFLSACSFYERYGKPGPLIDRWLREGGWSFAAAGTRSRYGIAPFSIGATYEYYTPNSQWWYVPGWDVRSFLSAQGVKCAAGDAETCGGIFAGRGEADPSTVTHIFSFGLMQIRYYSWWSHRPLGPYENHMLSDIAKMIGEESFRQFWTSPLPPPEAFKAATGKDAGSVVAEWSRRVYGPMVTGPAIPGRGAISALVLVALAIGWAISSGRRRQLA